ncbi:MAG: hypothetical protein JHC25_07790 [Thermodesulfobacterium sp.]|nr:hypothetical protein [Thermodesulfobacterium sp.]
MYKHTNLDALFDYMEVSAKVKLEVREGSPFRVSIYDIPFYFLIKPIKDYGEFAYPYRKRGTPQAVLYKLFRLGVLRVFWTQESLRSRLTNCTNCLDGWLYKDLFSDRERAYQAFSPMENIALVVFW